MAEKFTYRCGKCGKLVELGKRDKMRCVYCGSRILFKPRKDIIRKVKAR